MLAGGMESMSNTPHYLPSSRSGTTLGNAQLLDGIIHDGLWDPYDNGEVSIRLRYFRYELLFGISKLIVLFTLHNAAKSSHGIVC
jgi:hypothetical protein